MKPNSTTGLAVQFKDVTDGVIKIKNLVKMNTPIGSTAANNADQIWTYDGHDWTKYFYYSLRSVTKWVKTPATESFAKDAETEDTIANGQSFFFVRPNSTKATATDTATLSGEVVSLGSNPEITVAPNTTTAMAYPWPQAFQIKKFNEFNANPIGSTAASNADQIWTYDGHDWTKYFYYSLRSVTKWIKTPATESFAKDAETEDSIAVGQAFFFVRPNSTKASATDKIVFKQLTAE